MDLTFFLCLIGLSLTFLLHVWSLEHKDLAKRYGKARGRQVGQIFGVAANLLHLLVLLGFWFSFQPRFVFKFGQTLIFVFLGLRVYLSNLALSLPFLISGFWFWWDSEKRPGDETLMGHVMPKKIVTAGSYAIVRHPQSLGSNLFHLGMSILLGGVFSLLFTPFYFLVNYLAAKKEEEELIKEFGEKYKKYQKKVPMFIPGLKGRG